MTTCKFCTILALTFFNINAINVHAEIIDSYTFEHESLNCYEQRDECHVYSKDNILKAIEDKKNSILVKDYSQCRDDKNKCQKSEKSSYQLLKKCADIYRACNDNYSTASQSLKNLQRQTNDLLFIEYEKCDDQRDSCLDKQKSRLASEENDKRKSLTMQSIKSILSISEGLNFKLFGNMQQIVGFDKIRFGLSENDLSEIKGLDGIKEKRVSAKGFDSRTSRELIGSYSSRSFTLYNNFYPLLGQNRQIGILYNGSSPFEKNDIQQINLNLSGESYDTILINLEKKYLLNGQTQFTELGINQKFAVFNNGQVILWKNDVFKLRKKSETKDYFFTYVCPELQLIYSTPDLGLEIFLKSVLEKASKSQKKVQEDTKATSTKDDYSKF